MRSIQSNAKQLRNAVEAGVNASTIILEDGINVTRGIIAEHKLFFIIFCHSTLHALHAVSFVPFIDLPIEISARFGGDCTKSALENRFRRLKSDAKLINDAVAKGQDPITINVGDTNGDVACKGLGGNEMMFIVAFHFEQSQSTYFSHCLN